MSKRSKRNPKRQSSSAISQAKSSSPPSPDKSQPQYFMRYQGTSFQGPLPPPEVLRGYDEILPNAANRIITMAENNQAHRHELENQVILRGLKTESVGQILGFILYLAMTFVGGFLIYVGKSVVGLTAFLATTGTFASLFIYSKKSKQKEISEKRQ